MTYYKTLHKPALRFHLIGCAFVVAVLLPGITCGQLPTSFQKVELVTGLKNSVNFEFAPDGRIFIMDRYGEIFIYHPQTQTTVSAGTLNVFHDMEDGLLALAFDPQFATNNFVYIHYSDPALPKNRVSRFTMNGDQLDLSSEVLIIDWTSDRNGYYHAAGDMDFDSQGNLYIAIGDNTNHTPYAPLNETDRNQSSERTSSNSNDLRGKILRIKPGLTGSYTIPSGNLFPNGVGGLPEIYVMGARNPYKIFVDKTNTDWLFWGEVGPDANLESQLGPEGMDEINLVKTAGNYGWPYLSGKNEPYLNTYKQPNFYFDHANPVNLSKWNTGAVNLPPARPSWLEFFHGCYLAGPRYYYNSSLNNPKKLPSDFHQAFFYYDFNTDAATQSSKIWVVKMDASGNVISNQRFAQNVISGKGFIDLKIGPDGQLYILEYGAGCCPGNVGSGKLVRVDYTGIDNNKTPEVTLNVNTISGHLPLLVQFSSAGTIDPDGDPLTYEWDFQSDGIVDSNQPNPSFTYSQSGTFSALLRVTDSRGAFSSKSVLIYPGNTAATFTFNNPADGSMFSWEDMIQYDFEVHDEEDGSTENGSISCEDVSFIPAFGHLTHSHDGITINDCSGSFYLNPTSHDTQGQDNIYYIFKVAYTDNNGLTTFDQITVHPKVMEAEFYNDQNNTKLVDNTDVLGGGVYSVRALSDNSYLMLAGRNLQNINSISYRLASTVGGTIEVHADSPTGTLLSTVTVPSTGTLNNWTNVTTAISNPGGKHDLYFVFKKPGAINLLDLNYIEFRGPGSSTDNTPPSVYSIQILSKNHINIKFNEALDPASAQTVSNYSITNGINIASATLQDDGKTVQLFMSPLTFGMENQLTISNLKNSSGTPLSASIIKKFTMNQVLVRVNAGGSLVDLSGEKWLSSQYNIGGSVLAKPTLPINNTTADVLYQSELNGNFTMNIPVPANGIYDLKLHFAEIVYSAVGARVFNINIENNQYSLINYDIFSKSGFASPVIETFEDISVQDGFLNVTFTGVVQKAKLSALEVFYGDNAAPSPSVSIMNPEQGLTLAQPFKVNFKVEDWWIAPGSSHIQKIVDGVAAGNVYNTEPITFQNLTPGLHTIKLVLVNANNVPTTFSDEVQVNVVSASACIDNPFPLQWEQYVIGSDLTYRSPQIIPADLNGDGYKDIVTGGWWFENPGTPKGVWAKNIIGPPLNNNFLVHDLDKDGDLDLLGTQGTYLSSQLAWGRNDGHGNFTIYTNIPQAAGFPPGTANNNTFLAGSAIGNFEGVQNIQIALVWNGSETTKAPVKLLTVPADPVNGTWLVKDIAPNAVGEAINAVDIDKDGDLDLSQAKNWLRNNNGSWTTFTTGITMPTYYEHHLLADLNKDGVLDGVLTQIGENQEIVWFKVAANPTALWTKSTLGTDVDSGLSLDLADIDFDGDLDVITAEWKVEKRLIAFENDLCNTGTWIKHILHTGGTTGADHHNGAQTADLDNDGDLDIISVGWDKRTPRIYINNSSTIGGNAPPVVAAPIPDQPGAVGVLFNFVVPANTFNDPDGDALSYSATLASGSNLPSWLTFTASTRTFRGTPPAGSSSTLLIKVTANDHNGGTASDEFSITFSNVPPVVANVIPDQTAPAGQALSFVFAANTFTDANGDPLTYTANLSGGNPLPGWLLFNGSTRTFSGTPAVTNAGVYAIQVNASDNQSTVSDVFNYVITDPAVNQPPIVANNIPDLTASAGLVFNFTFPTNTFTDPDGDALTYSATLADNSPLPSWLGFNNSTRTFNGVPGAGDVGSISIKLTANDGAVTVSEIFNIQIEAGGSIRLNSGGGPINAYGVSFEADKHFVGGSTYSNTKITDIAGTIYDDLYKTEHNKPFVYQIPVPPGVYQVKLHFAEIYFGATGGGAGGAGRRVFNVTGEGVPLLSNFDIFAEVGAMRAVIKEFELNVTDGILNLNFIAVIQNPKVSAVEVVAKSTSTNNPPVLVNALADQTATVSVPFSSTFAANAFSDPDGDVLTYSATLANDSPLPNWLNFSSSTRTFSGTPPGQGVFMLKVAASDGKGGLATDIFSLTVGGTVGPEAIRINSGGTSFTSSSGQVFSADKLFSLGAAYTNNNITDIAGTNDDFIYRSERYKECSYNIPVPSGTYTVRLHFAEIYFGATGGGAGAPGKRVFNVTGEGVPLLTNFDIYAEVGAMTALVKEFEINVLDGTLNINLVKVIENPKINAIEVVPSGSSSLRTSSTARSGQVNGTSLLEEHSPELSAYPNPFESTTTLEYRPNKNEQISLQVLNVQGALVTEVYKGDVQAGNVYRYDVDASQLMAGVYFARLSTKEKTLFVKLALIK